MLFYKIISEVCWYVKKTNIEMADPWYKMPKKAIEWDDQTQARTNPKKVIYILKLEEFKEVH